MNALTREIVAFSIKRLLTDSRYFDICAFEQIAKVMNVQLKAEIRDKLRLLHCVDYEAMPSRIRAEVPMMVFDALRLGYMPPNIEYDRIVIEGVSVQEQNMPSKRGFFTRNRK